MRNRNKTLLGRALCAFGLHKWGYLPNRHGGQPMLRACIGCGKKQCWDYDKAREHGVIVWLDADEN